MCLGKLIGELVDLGQTLPQFLGLKQEENKKTLKIAK